VSVAYNAFGLANLENRVSQETSFDLDNLLGVDVSSVWPLSDKKNGMRSRLCFSTKEEHSPIATSS